MIVIHDQSSQYIISLQYIIDGGCENNSIDFTGGAGRKAIDRIVGGGGAGV